MRRARTVMTLTVGLLILWSMIPPPATQLSQPHQFKRVFEETPSWMQPSPYQAGQWLEYKSNVSDGQDEYILYSIATTTNSTWWHVQVWNQTTQTLNQTAYVKRVSGEGGHEHVYTVNDYRVISLGMQTQVYHWDRWFDLGGVVVGSTIGPLDSEGDSLTLTVNTTEYVTTPAGTFECWVANESKVFYDANYWIDKESNVTVQMAYDISPAFGGGRYMEQLSAASWVQPPVIANVQTDPLRFSCTISWTTDEPADSGVRYGTSSDNLNLTVLSSSLEMLHSADLTNLQPLTMYYFEVMSKDAWNNPTVDNNTGLYYNFTTLSADTPEITGILATPLSNTTVRISFDTDKATNTTVWYAKSLPLLNSVSDPAFLTYHEIDIFGLDEFTEYYYKVTVSDNVGNTANSTIRGFTTLDLTPPRIVSISHGTSGDSLNVTLESNEPVRCELYVGNDTDSMTLRVNVTQFAPSHALVAQGLPSYTDVFFKIRLLDISGNPREVLNGSVPFTLLMPDYLLPQVSHPDDVFTSPSAEPIITWQTSDQTPVSYEVLFDGIRQGVETWNGGTVTFQPDSSLLTEGTHTVELVLTDAYGNIVSDVVVVSISEGGLPRSYRPLGQEILVLTLLLLGLLGVIILLRRR